MTTLKETLVYCYQLINENIDALILNANTSTYSEALVALKKELKEHYTHLHNIEELKKSLVSPTPYQSISQPAQPKKFVYESNGIELPPEFQPYGSVKAEEDYNGIYAPGTK